MPQDLMIELEPLRSALDRLNPQLEELLSANKDKNRQVFSELAEQISEAWQVLAEQLSESGTPVLMDLLALYAENLDMLLASQEDGLSSQEQMLLKQWHEACGLYLRSPADEKTITGWISVLQEPLWLLPLNEDDAAELRAGLIELGLASCPHEKKTDVETPPFLPEAEIILDEIRPQAEDPFIEPLAERPNGTVDLDLVQMIGHEFGKVADDLTHTLAKVNCSTLAEYQQSLSANDFLLENINKACETVGLFGLSYVFRRLWLNVVAQAAKDHNYDEECNLFGIALILIQQYLTDIENDQHCSALVRHLHEPGWRRPLPETLQSALFAALNVPLADPDVQRAGLQRITANADDVSLVLPDDVDPELVLALLHELPLLTENFSTTLQEIVTGAHPTMDRLLDAQRVAHTLKGACNTIGIHGIAHLTHSLETILEALNNEQALPNPELGIVLLDTADCLSAMSDHLQGQGAAPEQALAILQQLLDWEYHIKKEGVTGAVVNNAGFIRPPQEIATENTDQNPSRVADKAVTTVPSAKLDELTEVAAEASSLGERAHEKIDGLLGDSVEIREITWQLSELVAEIDRLVNIRGVTARDNQSNQDFDSLELEQYSELHTCISRLAEIGADVREHNAQMRRQLLDTKNLLIEQRSMQKEHQQQVQALRMVPVQKIVSRCQRIVRQAGRMTGKEVELQITGESTLIDSEILHSLSDALMHLLRNAVDHGIESPEFRVKAGKPKRGKIHLSFTNDRNALTISCQDDGRGLDEAKIWATAQNKGWVTEQQTWTTEQIQGLIFHPGFSTKDQTSHVSGRGIGMDVIQTQIARMNGVMGLSSIKGHGLTVNLNIPSNLYDAPMLLVKIDERLFAVSERGIQRIFCALDGKLKADEKGDLRYHVEQHSYAAETLSALLGLDRKKQTPGSPAGLLFKAQNGTEKIVLVDQVIGYRTLMIRPFGDYLKGVYGVLGCVILGSGQVTPVVDLFELISDVERRGQADSTLDSPQIGQHRTKTLALVVDDSLSTRKSTAQLLKDSGYEVQTAVDGLDAIEKIEIQKPDVILSDLEMPRMNGIELTRYLRAAPELQDVPLIMISSRASEKHRHQADNAGVTLYLTKPFNEDDLIEKLNGLLEQKLIQAA